MDFPNEAKFLLDWSPSSGWSYIDFLQEKKFDPTLWYAVAETHLKHIGALEQLDKRGFTASTTETHEGYVVLSRSVAGIEQSVRLGASEIASALRWNFLQPAIGLDRINDPIKALNETLRNLTLSWAYEQFVKARTEYNRGQYEDALSLVGSAIEGNGIRNGYPSEFRFHYLLGRIRIGGWFGDFKNASRDIIDPEKAETAFLDAVRYRKHVTDQVYQDEVAADTDMAQMLVWAGRAAYIRGDVDAAIDHVRDGLGLITPASRGLYPAAQYQYAKFLCTRGKGGDLSQAQEAMAQVLAADNLLSLEAASEPEFTAKPDFLDTVLSAAREQQQTRYKKLEAEFDTLLRKIDSFVYDETSAADLMYDEVNALHKAREAVAKELAVGGLLDIDAAAKIALDAIPKPGFLFGLFKTRFNKDRLQRWENSKATRAAKDASSFLKWCEEEYKAAEEIYRKNGGFNREGGSDKFGYAVISTLLAVYMFFAQARWGGNAIIIAILFLAVALWLFLIFIRIKLGLVEGYEKYRSTKGALTSAQTDASRKDDVSAKAWQNFQRVIDSLSAISAPF